MKLLEKIEESKQHERNYVYVFILITICFALWGFANSVTLPMVNAFSRIFRISTAEASLVPITFNLGYFCMAIPAALFIQRFSFKKGIIFGLILYALGSFFFLPAKMMGEFYAFLGACFIMTCGLSFLETCCNPYVCLMGSEKHSVQRLNAVQSFNALGTVAGVIMAMEVHKNLNAMNADVRASMPIQQFNILKDYDLGILIQPYIYIVSITMIILVLIAVVHFPHNEEHEQKSTVMNSLRSLMHHENYREGVIAEFCYVGVQVACWTYIIQYGTRLFVAEGMEELDAMVLAQKYNIIAMICFAGSRFICTWLMQWFSPSRMLSVLSIILYCLILVNICMSMMFPTIYALALKGIRDHAKIAGAGLIMAILGGSFFPAIQAIIIESDVNILGLPSTNLSFILPLLCLAVVAWYGHRAYVRHSISGTE